MKGEDPPSPESISKVIEYSDEFKTSISQRSDCALCIEFEIYGLDARKAEDGRDGGAAGLGGNAGTYSIIAFGQTPMFTVSQKKGKLI